MIRAIQLGNKSFPINLIQGPLAGISCAPFRYLTRVHGQPAFSCTEMISCKTLINQSKRVYRRYIEKNSNEGPTSFQLSSNNPLELAHATKIITDYGADLIDLNCGCPVSKIRQKGAGSYLLTDHQKLYDLIYAMKMNTHLPVSIKIRVEGNVKDHLNRDIAKVVTDAGADFITVHGRHWTETYETPCRYDQIEYFVNELKIPVVGNGDVRCIESLKKMFSTGCAGVMIGRAGVGQPWLIQKLIAEFSSKIFAAPTSHEVGQIFLLHILELIKLLNDEKLAILQARKFAKYYARSLENRSEFNEAVNQCIDFLSLQKITADFFD
jgi:nifR3 family TIM-barrel protein